MSSIRLLVFALLLFCGTADASLKINGEALDGIRTIAVVGYSFERDEISMYGPAGQRKGRKPIQLTDADHELIVMRAALNNMISVFREYHDLDFRTGPAVVSNSYYRSISKAPSKKERTGWYFPLGYRDIKLENDVGVRLCEELGVDAVLEITFTYDLVDNVPRIDRFNIYEKRFRVLALKSEMRLVDKNGNTLISGTTSSEPLPTSDGMATAKEPVRSYFPSLLVSYLNALKQELR